MADYFVDLGKARFDFDLDLLEHNFTEVPLASGETPLRFDHQKKCVFQGERVLFAYSVIDKCYWQAASPSGLECGRADGLTVKFSDPNMDFTQAKEVLFRLANICEWSPQNTPPQAPVVKEVVEEVPFDPSTQFRLPRESKMVSFVPAPDWTKSDELTITHLGQPLQIRFNDAGNEMLVDGQPWHRMEEVKEVVFKRGEDVAEFILPDGRWALTIGNDRLGQIVETRIKAFSRTHRWAMSEATPDSGRNQVVIKVDILRAVLEAGQTRIRGQREVLWHHGQQLIRLDGEVFGSYSDITQMRVQMLGDKLTLRVWMKPKTLLILEANSPTTATSSRVPDFLRALTRATNIMIED